MPQNKIKNLDYSRTITSVRENIHISQSAAADPASALRLAIESLPYDDAGNGIFDEELHWLIQVSGSHHDPVTDCKNT